MNAKVRSRVVAALLLAAMLGASCAAQRKEEVKRLVTRYLDYEQQGDFTHQRDLIDVESARALSLSALEVPNPAGSKRLTAYAIKSITVGGASAQATVVETFQMQYGAGGQGLPEKYLLHVYLVHQGPEWRVDEIRTRTEQLDNIIAPGAGNTWLMTEKAKRPPGM
jgi:hypothetical protein